jgi:hypothetical protein
LKNAQETATASLLVGCPAGFDATAGRFTQTDVVLAQLLLLRLLVRTWTDLPEKRVLDRTAHI